MPMIEAHAVTKRFGARTAVEALTLEVAEGEVLGLLGPNGAGKTTTMRMLAGMIAPSSGYAVVAGLRVDRHPEEVHELMGFLTESPGFYDRLSAWRNLEFFAGLYQDVPVDARVKQYLELVGLWERRDDRVGTFSKGMKQRMALARALLHEPHVLFLDEPTSGLDPEAAREVRDLVKELRGRGRTIIVSTHNLAEAEALCDRVAIIQTGLVAVGTPQELRCRLAPQRVVVRLEAVSEAVLGALRRLSWVRSVELDGARLLVELEDPAAHRAELVRHVVQAGGNVLEVTDQTSSMEEVYLSLIRTPREGAHEP